VLYPTGGNSYYSNSFDDGNLGVFNNYKISGTSNQTLAVSTTTPLKGTRSLRSVNRISPLGNAVYGRILPAGTSIDVGMEWSFLYKYSTTSNSTPSEIVDFPNVTADKSGFRYWLISNNISPSNTGGTGVYFSQVGNVLYFKSKEGDFYTRDAFNFTMAPGTIYNIKIKRTAGGWGLFVDAYSINKTDATTLIAVSNFTGPTTYQYSVLEVNEARNSSSNFLQFDDLKLYTQRINFTNITSTTNGLSSNPISQGQQNIVIFGLKVNLRGIYNFISSGGNGSIQFNLGNLGNSSQVLSGIRLYESTDALFNPDNDPLLSAIPVSTGTNFNVSTQIDAGSSEASGTDKYYFLVVDILPNANFSGLNLQVLNYKMNYNNFNGGTTASSPLLTGNAYSISQSYVWTGGTGTDWSVASNWTLYTDNNGNKTLASVAPGFNSASTYYVSIPNSTTNNPVLVGSATVNTLTIESSKSVKISANLSVTNALSALGTLEFNTSTNSTFSISTNVLATLGNLTINKGSLASKVTLPSANAILSITGSITPTAGELITNGKLTLKSNETKTAYIDKINNTATSKITGAVVVERFMKGGSNTRRGYRLMSSPVHDATQLSKYSVAGLMQNIYITGAGGATNGFDASPNNGATIYHYRESNPGGVTQNDYTPISSVSADYFNSGEGAYVFYRGLRTATDVNGVSRFSTSVTPEDNVVSFSGELNQGNVSLNLSYTPSTPTNTADGFNLVGNPYASTIDLNSGFVTGNNINTNNFYVLDPSTKNFAVYQRAGMSTGNATQYIASGQGFFVKATSAASPSITFSENAKVSTQLTPTGTNKLLMSTGPLAAEVAPKYIRLNMINPLDSTAQDDIVLNFSSSAKSAFKEIEDAFDFGGNGTTFLSSLSSDQIKLAINSLPAVTENMRIPIVANSTVSGTFNFNAANLNVIEKTWNVFLVDHFKTDSVKLNINPAYSFSVDRAIAASYAADRFEIVFHEKESLIAKILTFTGNQSNRAIDLGWKPSNSAYYNVLFTLQRSTDGITYSDIYAVQSDSRAVYYYQDKSLTTGQYYYRLKQEDANGHITFSTVLPFSLNGNFGEVAAFKMYPNPVKTTYTVDINVPDVKEVRIRIIDLTGRIVQSYLVTGQSSRMDGSKWSSGTYIIEIVNNASNEIIGRSSHTNDVGTNQFV
ncbi:MAG: T9SS type A sorting domain-containing protein, partial [Flavobacterium sp.]